VVALRVAEQLQVVVAGSMDGIPRYYHYAAIPTAAFAVWTRMPKNAVFSYCTVVVTLHYAPVFL